MDVLIYAVERSLDSYKFNLLHNKQLYIDQIKTNSLGKRTIDEGSLDDLPPDAGAAAIGKKLNELSEKNDNHVNHEEIGTLYGFKLLVKTENSLKDGFNFKENRFFVAGDGGIKYTYNNVIMAHDPKLAAMNFLNALYRIPTLVDNERKRCMKAEKDLPVLREVAHSSWKKEGQLKGLKNELREVEKKIIESISPKEETVQQDERSVEKIQNGKEYKIKKNI